MPVRVFPVSLFEWSAFLFIYFGLLFLIYFYYSAKGMPVAGSPLFRIGYFLYANTRLGYSYYKRLLKKAREKYPDGHCEVHTETYANLSITVVPILKDNFSYIIWDKTDDTVVLLDPADAKMVCRRLTQLGIPDPVAILSTHKHWDHSGGNNKIKAAFPHKKICVYGSGTDAALGLTNDVDCETAFEIGEMKFTALHTPGHTIGHTTYVLHGKHFNAPDSLFTGDILFVAGVGRIFEGSANAMMSSLDIIVRLKPDTLIWPGHEYSKNNLEFAKSVDPGNEFVKSKTAEAELLWEANKPVCPSTIQQERRHNPFLRLGEKHILDTLGVSWGKQILIDKPTRTKALVRMRKMKDEFNYQL